MAANHFVIATQLNSNVFGYTCRTKAWLVALLSLSLARVHIRDKNPSGFHDNPVFVRPFVTHLSTPVARHPFRSFRGAQLA